MDSIIYTISWLTVYVGIPFWFILAPVFSGRFSFIPARKIGTGILLSTLIMWPLMLGHRISIEVPYNMARTDDPMYDGVGGNAAILMTGWLLALIFQLPHVVLRLIVDLVAKKKRNGESDGAGQTATSLESKSESNEKPKLESERHTQ